MDDRGQTSDGPQGCLARGVCKPWRTCDCLRSSHFTYFDPTALGAIEYNILELQALPDGHLVLGFPSSGLLVWDPGDVKGHRITQRDGLPGERIGRTSQDRMHDPPLLLVPTDGGLAIFRGVP